MNKNLVKEMYMNKDIISIKEEVKYCLSDDAYIDLYGETYSDYYTNLINTLIAVKNNIIPSDSREAFNALDELYLESFLYLVYPNNEDLQRMYNRITLMYIASSYEVYIPYTVAELEEMKKVYINTIEQVKEDFKDTKFNIPKEPEFESDEEEDEFYTYLNGAIKCIENVETKTRILKAGAELNRLRKTNKYNNVACRLTAMGVHGYNYFKEYTEDFIEYIDKALDEYMEATQELKELVY